VVNITAPSTVRLAFDDLQGEKRFTAVRAFGASKMANLLFTGALASRLEGTGVTVFAYHPGLVRTGLMREARFPFNILTRAANFFAAGPEKAGEELAALLDGQVPEDWQGKLVHKGRPIGVNAYASDEGPQEELWDVSLRLAEI
jgi:NAD(P)-dependent dehydrogenase (short-subunit alcohol dehydrogenase family)